jgi:hypothetical protein
VLTIAGMGLAALEGAVRAVRATPPGRFASRRVLELTLLAVIVTSASGLALLASGLRPRELLHFVYAVLAFAMIPVADSLVARRPPRSRGLARLGGAAVGLVVVARLFGTG